MIAILKQERFWIEEKSQFYRRTELVNQMVIWERPSQYGTFTIVLMSDKIKLEDIYLNNIK